MPTSLIRKFAGGLESIFVALRSAGARRDFSLKDVRPLSMQGFRRRFSCDVRAVPKNVVLLGWSAQRKAWYCAPKRVVRHRIFNKHIHRVFKRHMSGTLVFLNDRILPLLPEQDFWMLFCFFDGWREHNLYSTNYRWVDPGNLEEGEEWRGEAGEIPLLRPAPFRIVCFNAHRGDPSALLIPEAHYLNRDYYRDLFATVASHAVPWAEKQARGSFCASNRGECANYFPPLVDGREHPRLYFQRVVARHNLPIDVRLGKGVSYAEQLRYKYIIDIDGCVRTWAAWAWKMRSGSVVISADSPWESFFTRLFEPWVHFVPIANDFSDLPEKLAWCRDHDDQCMEIAERARRHSELVYSPDFVADAFARQFQNRDSRALPIRV
jgi:hypothetical protein